jgi:CRISPR-associated protein Csx16
MSRLPKTWIVTRHKGAAEFINALGYVGISAQHLDLADVYSGDTVVGVIPMGMAEQLLNLRVNVIHLYVELTSKDRGEELSATRLAELNAELRHVNISSSRAKKRAF